MPLHYLALGDSYTLGEGVSAQASWPMQLVEKLRRQAIAIEDPKLVAATGWSTDELSAGMDRAALAPAYDLVTLLIGVNNQYRGRPAQEYGEQFRALLLRAITLSGHRPARVLTVSIPDWGATPFGRASGRDLSQIANELDQFNAMARDAAVQAGAHFVDITVLSRKHARLVASDGLHPSGAHYALWAQAIAPAAARALRSGSRS